MGWAKKVPLPKICHTYPTMMKLGSYTLSKEDSKNIKQVTEPMSSANITVRNTHGGVLLLKVTIHHGCFSRFLNCTYGTKSRNASHIRNTFKKAVQKLEVLNRIFSFLDPRKKKTCI